MEIKQKEDVLEPMSPNAQYMKSSVLSLTILGVLELEFPIDDSTALKLFEDALLRKNPRFSSIVVTTKKGAKKWKKVEANLKDHVHAPTFPSDMSKEYYDECFTEYISNLAKAQLPENKPLWELHIINYPTTNAAATLIFNLHHSLGDGYSFMSTLLSCLQRAGDPSMPLTFPSRQSNTSRRKAGFFSGVPSFFSAFSDTVHDVIWSVFKSSFIEDDKSPIISGEAGAEFRPIVMSTATFSIDEVKQIKNRLKVTINDVLTGIIFFATRIYMQESNHESGNANSTALVLLNTRAKGGNYKSLSEMVKPDAEMPWGNRIAWLPVPIPKLQTESSDQLENPINFVKDARQMIKRQRNPAAVFITGQLLYLVRKIRGPEAAAQYMRTSLTNTSMAISNMIGPIEQMALSKDHPVKGLYFSVAGSPQSIFVSIVSYAGKLRIAMTVEKGFINPNKYKSCIQYAFNTIYEAALDSPPSTTKYS